MFLVWENTETGEVLGWMSRGVFGDFFTPVVYPVILDMSTFIKPEYIKKGL